MLHPIGFFQSNVLNMPVRLWLKSVAGVFTDVSSNAFTLTPSANAIHSTDVPFGTEKSFGVTSGVGRIVVSTSGANLNPGVSDWKVSGWVKLPLNHPDGITTLFSRIFSGSNYWLVVINNNGSVTASANHTAVSVTSAAGVVLPNTWILLKWERIGNTAFLSANNTVIASVSCVGLNMNSSNTTSPGIGGPVHDTWGQNNGLIYDLQISF